jgi:hypothetical protein
MAPPTTIAPVQEQELYVAKETPGSAGTIPATVGSPVAFTSFKPSDKPMWLEDESYQGSMGDFYGMYQGPLIAGADVGGHVFDHGLGEALYNLLGDYTVSGTAASPASVTSAPAAAGATSLTVASGGASFTAGMWVWIEDAGTPAANEVVKIGAGSTSTNVVLDATTPLRFAHLTATPFTNTTAPYTHAFAVLNGSVGAANGPAQGPTHCFTHRQGIAANGANVYAYGCFSEVTLTGNADKLLDWSGKIVCASRVTAGSAVGFANTSSVQPYPSWRTAVGWGGPASGGTKISTVPEHTITLGRVLKAMNTEQGSQQPYIIARGKQPCSGKVTIGPAIDDSALTAMLANSQPQLQFVSSNGLSGASLVSVQVDIIAAALTTADIEGDVLFGFSVPFKVPHTAASSGGITTTGASGGKGAVKVTLINAVPTY